MILRNFYFCFIIAFVSEKRRSLRVEKRRIIIEISSRVTRIVTETRVIIALVCVKWKYLYRYMYMYNGRER